MTVALTHKLFLGTLIKQVDMVKKVGQTVAHVKVVSDRKTMIGIFLEGFLGRHYNVRGV